DYPMNPCRDHRVSAGRSASLIAMRLQIDVQRSPTRLRSGFFQRQNLRVLDAFILERPSAYHVAAYIGNHRSNAWIRRSKTDALLRQFQRPVQMLLVRRMQGHSAKNLSCGPTLDARPIGLDGTTGWW